MHSVYTSMVIDKYELILYRKFEKIELNIQDFIT